MKKNIIIIGGIVLIGILAFVIAQTINIDLSGKLTAVEKNTLKSIGIESQKTFCYDIQTSPDEWNNVCKTYNLEVSDIVCNDIICTSHLYIPYGINKDIQVKNNGTQAEIKIAMNNQIEQTLKDIAKNKNKADVKIIIENKGEVII